MAARIPEIHPQDDGAYIIDGTALVREINRALGWSLPQDGPRTLSGMLVEYLEFIPEAACCVRIADYRIEILQTKDNMIRAARIMPPPAPPADDGEEDG
jgi:Mg2+/Co2+ transporter CorB